MKLPSLPETWRRFHKKRLERKIEKTWATTYLKLQRRNAPVKLIGEFRDRIDKILSQRVVTRETLKRIEQLCQDFDG